MLFAASLLSAVADSGWGLPFTPSGIWTWGILAPYAYWLNGSIPSGGGVSILFDGLRAIAGVDTIIEEDIAGGYQMGYFYRDPDGAPYTGSDTSRTTFDQVEVVNDIGVRQGLTWDGELKRNKTEGFLFYRVHYDHDSATPGNSSPLIFLSSFPDRLEIFSNSFLAGLDYYHVVTDTVHGTLDGIYAEASIEWGPRFFWNSDGSADFFRLNGTVEAFKRLYVSPHEGHENRFSMYAADYLSVDYAGGGSVPVSVFESYGGHYPRPSFGITVRGFEPGLFGADFKALNQLEVRMVGPSFMRPGLLPGLYAFVDTLCFDDYFADPMRTPGGVIASTGFGLFLSIFDSLNFTVYAAFPVVGQNLSRTVAVLGASLHLAF